MFQSAFFVYLLTAVRETGDGCFADQQRYDVRGSEGTLRVLFLLERLQWA